MLNNNNIAALSQTINLNSKNNDINGKSVLEFKSKTIDLALQRLPLQLSEPLHLNDVLQELVITEHNKNQKNNLAFHKNG